MDTFEVGEVAIAQNLTYRPEKNGLEVIVRSRLYFANWISTSGNGFGEGWGYDVKWSDGDITFQEPWELRKRRPPQDWAKLCELDNIPIEPEDLLAATYESY